MSLQAVDVGQSREEKFQEFLLSRPKPQRYTTQQRDLVRHIFAKHKHFDAEELVHELKEAELKVSRATVYRTLAKLVEAKLLKKIELGERTVYDHDYGYPEHEHFVCNDCNTMIEFESPEMSEIIAKLAAQCQFRVVSFDVVVRGTCSSCNQASAVKRRLVM